jgi:hypothetical protein
LKHLVLFFIVLTSCKQTVSTNQLLDYTLNPKNGLLKKEKKNGVVLQVLYKPNQLIVAQEIKGRNLRPSQIDSVQSYFNEFDYFLLRLSRNGKEIETGYAADQVKFVQVNNYLSFEIGKNVSLVQDRDTIKVKDFIHTRTFGSSPSSDILFVFKSRLQERRGEVKFIFNDEMFNSGLSEFDFALSNIKSLPIINLIEKPL